MTTEAAGRVLSGVRVYESVMTTPGTFITTEGAIWMHPLDVIALRAPAALDRLDAAMEWILAKTLARLDSITT